MTGDGSLTDEQIGRWNIEIDTFILAKNYLLRGLNRQVDRQRNTR